MARGQCVVENEEFRNANESSLVGDMRLVSVRDTLCPLCAPLASEKILDSFHLESVEEESKISTVLGTSAAGLEEGSCARDKKNWL